VGGRVVGVWLGGGRGGGLEPLGFGSGAVNGELDGIQGELRRGLVVDLVVRCASNKKSDVADRQLPSFGSAALPLPIAN
jgi:hypothetical protein